MGGGDYVNCGSGASLKITGNITLEAWIKSNAFSASNRVIIAKGTQPHADPYRFYSILVAGTSDKPRISLSDGTPGSQIALLGTTVLLANTWYHMVGTWNSSDRVARIYLNGILENSVTTTFSILGTNNVNPRIGSNMDTTELFIGTLDEVRIYDAALEASQIKARYVEGLDKLYSKGKLNGKEYYQRLTETGF